MNLVGKTRYWSPVISRSWQTACTAQRSVDVIQRHYCDPRGRLHPRDPRRKLHPRDPRLREMVPPKDPMEGRDMERELQDVASKIISKYGDSPSEVQGIEKIKMEEEMNQSMFEHRQKYIEDYQKSPRKDIKVVERNLGDSD